MFFATSPRFLRTVLLLDAASVLFSGVPQVLATAWLARWTALDPTLLLSSGLFLFVYSAFVVWIGTRQPIPAAPVRLVIAGNLAWGVGCMGLIAIAASGLSSWGVAYLLMHVVAVTLLAALQWAGLRQANVALHAAG
ncbi:hypothetical protein O4H66_11955 [Comamonadaceae bacterium G21597-S1]|nr:hypothetical protein [Comamonadaceae bacterium G21597-S1]